jgi:signal transduction histidine kinase
MSNPLTSLGTVRATQRTGSHRGGGAVGTSLWFRVVLALALFIAVTLAAMFFAIDYFVSDEFRRLHEQRTELQAAQAQRTVSQELAQIESLNALLVNDMDLFNNTYYFLYLEGEREHPQGSVDRIARAFQLGEVALLDHEGRAIVRSGTDGAVTTGRLRISPANAPRTAAIWVGDAVWIYATGHLIHNQNIIATLVTGRPLRESVTQIFGPEQATRVSLADHQRHIGVTVRIPTDESAHPPVVLNLTVADTVAEALAKVKNVLAALLSGAGVLLMLVIAWFVTLQLRPLEQLTAAAGAIGRGQFSGRLQPGGSLEVRTLVHAFNAMVDDLAKLREMEHRLRHQEQLSALGRVAARVAHDINNPLTVLRNIAELNLRQPGRSDEEVRDLQQMIHQCDLCLNVTQGLLEHARPRQPLTTLLELGRLCQDAVARSAVQMTSDVRLRMLLPDESIPVAVDPWMFEQMLENVLVNAGEAAGPAGEVTLHVGRDGDRACVCVTDSGPGFSEQARRHLFEPFFTTKAGGTGLGLASSLAIARAHGGTIEVGGEGGGRVSLFLPLAGVSAESAAQAASTG